MMRFMGESLTEKEIQVNKAKHPDMITVKFCR